MPTVKVWDGSQWVTQVVGYVEHNHSADYHTKEEVTNLLEGKAAVAHTHVKADIGLGNVDNTSDIDKPVSNAQLTALNNKASIWHGHMREDIQDFAHSHSIADLPVAANLEVSAAKVVRSDDSRLGSYQAAHRAKRSAPAAQTIAHATETNLTFGTINYDNASLFTSNTRVTVSRAGYWRVAAFVIFASVAPTSGGRRVLRVAKNSVTASGQAVWPDSNHNVHVHCSWEGEVEVGDYFEVTAFQTSGGNLALSDSWFSVSEFSV